MYQEDEGSWEKAGGFVLEIEGTCRGSLEPASCMSLEPSWTEPRLCGAGRGAELPVCRRGMETFRFRGGDTPNLKGNLFISGVGSREEKLIKG